MFAPQQTRYEIMYKMEEGMLTQIQIHSQDQIKKCCTLVKGCFNCLLVLHARQVQDNAMCVIL